jgi:pyruvate dehydrogenase E2 component (dihydrolipoamide acetyltransferase)
MAIEVVMPKLGLNMSEGLLVKWLKKEGDLIKRGEPLFIIETDKVTTESTAQADGVLGRILVEAGQTVPVRTVVATILAEGETLDSAQTEIYPERATPSQEAQATVSVPTVEPSAQATRPGRVLASPLAKRLAIEHGIDLSAVHGSGPDGRISQEDVERVIVSREPLAPVSPSQIIPIEGLRAIIAERMALSVQSTAQLTLHSDVDASGLLSYRKRMKANTQEDATHVPSYNAILIFIVAQVLKEHPFMNARQVDQTIHLLPEIHVGLAVETESGLVVVVVRDADKKSIVSIHKELNTLIERALARKSLPDDLTGSTFTITNLGVFGIDSFTPILNPPEVGILGIGRIAEKLVIQEGKVVQRPMVTLSLTVDHRLVDGVPASRFLQSVATHIAELV